MDTICLGVCFGPFGWMGNNAKSFWYGDEYWWIDNWLERLNIWVELDFGINPKEKGINLISKPFSLILYDISESNIQDFRFGRLRIFVIIIEMNQLWMYRVDLDRVDLSLQHTYMHSAQHIALLHCMARLHLSTFLSIFFIYTNLPDL